MLKFDNFLIICITFFQDDDDDDENGEQETPRLVWSMGLKCDKAKCLLMRLATKSESCWVATATVHAEQDSDGNDVYIN